MADYDLAIHGATVVTSRWRRRASVYVAGGLVAEVSEARRTAAREVDGAGLYLLPGVVDGHVHFMDPAEPDREDFITGSSAAAVGGVTTVVEHTHAQPVLDAEDLRRKADYLRDRSLVDFGLAAHVWPDRIEQLPALWHAGATYFKLFTCTTHGVPGLSNADLLRAFQAIAELRGLALVHCEDEAITAANEGALRAAGVAGGCILPMWRSREAELVAASTVALLARLARVRAIIAHAAQPAVVDVAAAQRAQGADLWIETCPQYLYLEEAEVLEQGALRKFTPPARARSRWEREELWRRVALGPVTHVSSDHAPSTRAHKARGVWPAPFGLPGVETTLSLLLEGVAGGYVSLERVVELASETPARLYGFYPRKGTLRPGADADLVLVDLAARRRLDDDAIVSKAGWSPFAGVEPRGVPVVTFVRGELVAQGGRPIGRPGWGRFLPGAGAR
ncbi:MAG: dihydroorotase family protein [Chloroflexi bacterium]|nr:dihydroorotase family protein [Chloroflexota bacterium]